MKTFNLKKTYVNILWVSITGKQLRRDVHNEERVSPAVSPRKGGGDEAEVCPQVVQHPPFLCS